MTARYWCGEEAATQFSDNDPVAIEQGIFGAYQTTDVELSGLILQQFGNLFTDTFAVSRLSKAARLILKK